MLDEEQQLIARLRKIEALFARPGTEGERRAAEHASHRIRARLTALPIDGFKTAPCLLSEYRAARRAPRRGTSRTATLALDGPRSCWPHRWDSGAARRLADESRPACHEATPCPEYESVVRTQRLASGRATQFRGDECVHRI